MLPGIVSERRSVAFLGPTDLPYSSSPHPQHKSFLPSVTSGQDTSLYPESPKGSNLWKMGPKVLVDRFYFSSPQTSLLVSTEGGRAKARKEEVTMASLSLGCQESCLGLLSLQTVPAALQGRQGRNGKRGTQGHGNPVAPAMHAKLPSCHGWAVASMSPALRPGSLRSQAGGE